MAKIFHHRTENGGGDFTFLLSVVIVECITDFSDLILRQLKFSFFFSLEECETRTFRLW